LGVCFDCVAATDDATIGKQRYGLPTEEDRGTEPRIEAGKVRLRDVLKSRKNVIDYLYDFGDSWGHRSDH
jgi:Plasmid pRiA4b ORF-3-like protein